MKNLTINQLLDRMQEIKVSNMTEELGQIRQHLIDYKRNGGCASGLILVNNTEDILSKIEVAYLDK